MNHSSEHFSTPLLNWFDKHGRKDLPWQHPRSAYRVWISEIMLQQTQVQTVLGYFARFMERFPELSDLAKANDEEVMALWSGLGYYSRARNLHKTAQMIYQRFQGQFPEDPAILVQLPGIGPSTAAAITSQAFNQQTAILDGNVKRVLSRYFLVDGHPEKSDVKKKLWELAAACMPKERCADYTQAIMDLGATCCTTRNPSCMRCPVQAGCLAWSQQKVNEYPAKKIKKNIPHKHQQFLLLYRADRSIYLEKNPPSGLWGSLWCMPGIDAEEDAIEYIFQKYNLQSLSINDLADIKHSFSHFHLHIRARLIETCAGETKSLKETTGKWFKVQDRHNLALAKPTRDIIDQFISLLGWV